VGSERRARRLCRRLGDEQFLHLLQKLGLKLLAADVLLVGIESPATLPSRSITNLVKFHFGSPPMGSAANQHLVERLIPSPFTLTFSNIGNVTLNLLLQNFAISRFVPAPAR